MQVKFKKVHRDAVIPQYQSDGAAAVDLHCVDVKQEPGYYEYDIGLAVEIPPGHVGLLFPRSSVSNTNMSLANCVGVIDEDFRGCLTARFRTANSVQPKYRVGDRVCQLMVLPIERMEIEEVEELSTTARGAGAFGSTGK